MHWSLFPMLFVRQAVWSWFGLCHQTQNVISHTSLASLPMRHSRKKCEKGKKKRKSNENVSQLNHQIKLSDINVRDLIEMNRFFCNSSWLPIVMAIDVVSVRHENNNQNYVLCIFIISFPYRRTQAITQRVVNFLLDFVAIFFFFILSMRKQRLYILYIYLHLPSHTRKIDNGFYGHRCQRLLTY